MSDNLPIILGFDPGKDKCGVAIVDRNRQLLYHQVVLGWPKLLATWVNKRLQKSIQSEEKRSGPAARTRS